MPRLFVAALLMIAWKCTPAAQYEVNSLADAGPGSLRAAILAVNAGNPADSHEILFRLPGTSGAVINLATPLPQLRAPFVRLIGRPALDPGAPPAIRGPANVPALVFGESSQDVEVRDVAFLGAIDGDGCMVATAQAPTATLLLDGVRFDGCRREASSVWDDRPLAGASIHATGHVTVLNSAFLDGRLLGLTSTRYLDGGFIAVEEGSLYVEGSHFENAEVVNETDASICRGGAIAMMSGDLVIVGSDFRRLSAFCGGQSYGGAVASMGKSLTLRSSRIEASASTVGGGVWYRPNSSSTISVENSSFVGNRAERGTDQQTESMGGALYIAPMSPSQPPLSRVRSTTFSRNSSASGVGAHLAAGEVIWLTFHSNLLGETGLSSDGQWATACELRGTSAPASGISYSLATDDSCNVFQQMQQVSVDQLRVDHWPDPGSLMTSVSLRAESPAVDAGSPMAPEWGSTQSCPPVDLAGVARPLDGNGDSDPRCDVGAWEFVETQIFADSFEE